MTEKKTKSGERRLQKRFKVEPGALVLETLHNHQAAGAVVDISQTGMCVICEKDLFELDETLASKIVWAGGGCPVNMIACMIRNKSKILRRYGYWRKTKSYFRYGMSFVDVEEPRRAEIQSCIDNHTVIEDFE